MRTDTPNFEEEAEEFSKGNRMTITESSLFGMNKDQEQDPNNPKELRKPKKSFAEREKPLFFCKILTILLMKKGWFALSYLGNIRIADGFCEDVSNCYWNYCRAEGDG